MEKHKCKLCFKSFANGRALGGHMRSHMMNLPIQPKPEQQQQPPIQLRDEAVADSVSSSSSDEEEDKGLSYLLRENPKKSFRFVDPEFSFAVDAGSVIVQDRESETESSKNPTRRRSKRTRKLNSATNNEQENHFHRVLKVQKSYKTESSAEPEQPVSSISDATTEEDVAFCLMMLSRDKWKREENGGEGESQDEEEEDGDDNKSLEDSYESMDINLCNNNKSSSSTRVRGKYKCETCKKTFRSYQALGGHRASHKKMRMSIPIPILENQFENQNLTTTTSDRKIHECPVCFRVFSSGQALGGHKRSHGTGSASTIVPAKNSAKFVDNLIDLNLPAPMDDDDISQIELSAVSDAEFVNQNVK